MRVLITLMVSLLMGLPAVLSAQEPASVEDLRWLAGCWASLRGETGSGEQWTLPAGGTLFGVGRTVRDSRTVAYEFLQIREIEAGGLEYIARPSGQAEAAFLLVRLSDSEVVFENLDHDFPQRIMYRLEGPDSLLGRIEGKVGSKARSVDFPMTRANCTAPPRRR